MLVEFEPGILKKALLANGLSEIQARDVEAEFFAKNQVLEDELLAERLIRYGNDLHSIIAIFSKLGIGKEIVIGMLERYARQKLGSRADIHTLEVEV
jgi:hypothetical protein